MDTVMLFAKFLMRTQRSFMFVCPNHLFVGGRQRTLSLSSVNCIPEKSVPAESLAGPKKDAETTQYGLSVNYIADLLTKGLPSLFASRLGTEKKSIPQEPPAPTTEISFAAKKARSKIVITGPSRNELDRRTVSLIRKVRLASSSISKLLRIEEFRQHLLQFPECREEASQIGAETILLRLKHGSYDGALLLKVNECLALLGFVPHVKGYGISLLAIDGGGTRGLMALEILEALEAECKGQRIHESFDYIVGVSTGAIIAALLAGSKLSLRDCKEVYKKIAGELFVQSRVWGAKSLLLNHSYYDTDAWISMLRQAMGERTLIETAGKEGKSARLAFVSAVVNQPRIEAFLFRNYNHPSQRHSVYPGSCNYYLWQALQASGAAPGYFQECRLGDYIHQDGGVLVNNPTAVGLHECKLLWPAAPVQCVVSIGNGRSAPLMHQARPRSVEFSSLKEKIIKMVDSATDTEAVHLTMNDLLPMSVYFRFNPYMSEVCALDENRPEKLERMQQDAQLYCRKNLPKIKAAATLLMRKRPLRMQVADWVRHRWKLYFNRIR